MKKILAWSICLMLSVAVFAADPVAKIGDEAPNFTLMDHNGDKVSLSDFNDKIVVLEWINPDCPFVIRHYKAKTMTELQQKYKDKGVVWLAVNSSHYATADDNTTWVKKHDIQFPILTDANGKVGHLYGAKTTPHMYIVNKGKLVYNGSIDNDPEGAGASVNYVDQALTALLAGKDVPESRNRPYGCSVKYKK